MSDSIEGVVKSWLIDPNWQKVFKHTFDVFQDYISYILVKLKVTILSKFSNMLMTVWFKIRSQLGLFACQSVSSIPWDQETSCAF